MPKEWYKVKVISLSLKRLLIAGSVPFCGFTSCSFSFFSFLIVCLWVCKVLRFFFFFFCFCFFGWVGHWVGGGGRELENEVLLKGGFVCFVCQLHLEK